MTTNTTSCRVVNYNMLVPHWAEQEKPSLKSLPWQARKEALAQRMIQLQPDCICLQEVERFNEIQDCMNRYGYKGIFAQRNNGEEEGCAIFYKDREFDVLSSHVSYFNDGTGRMILSAEVKPKSSHESFHLVNSHAVWDSSSPERRRQEIKGVESLAFDKSQSGKPVIVCADLNTARNEGEFLKGFSEKGFDDTLVKAGNSWKNSFVEKGSNGEKYFTTYDYIFSKNIELSSADIIGNPNDLKDDLEQWTVKEPSDHLPMVASFKLKAVASKETSLQTIGDFLKNGKIAEAYNALIQAFPEAKNELYGIYYALIKNQLDLGQNYFGCAEHAFLKTGAFQNFDGKDELRQCALALKVFELTLKGTSEKQNSLFELPGNLREALKWGFWLFEGMPEGEADFGKSFFLSNPTHPTVLQMIEEIKQNGLAVTSPNLKKEIDAFGLKLDSSLSNENLLKEFDNLSKQTQELIKKCLWVKAGRPTNKGWDFSGDVIKKNPRDPLLLTVVKNLQAKIYQ